MWSEVITSVNYSLLHDLICADMLIHAKVMQVAYALHSLSAAPRLLLITQAGATLHFTIARMSDYVTKFV